MHKHALLGPASFYKKAAAIAVPVTLQTLIQNLVSLVDNFMVAGLGDLKMSGVNVTNQFMFFFFVLLNTMMLAGGIFMSQFNGCSNREGMGQVLRFKIFTGTLLAAGMAVLSLLFPEELLSVLLNRNVQREAIVREGVPYFRLITVTFLPIVLSTALSSSLRETGRVVAPLLISVAATLVNTFFNWVLIYGNLGAPRLEIEGAAVATGIARVTELVLFAVYVRKIRPGFLFRLRDLLRIRFRLFASILRKSALILVTEISWAATEMVMTAVYYGRGGAEIVAGLSGAWAIANVFMSFNGIHTATGVLIGGRLGRGELEEAKREAEWMLNGSFLFGLGLCALASCSTVLIPFVFGNLSGPAQVVCRNMIFVISVYLPVWAYLNAQFAVARSGGDAVMGAWVDLCVNSVLFLPGIFLLVIFTGLGPVEMYAIVKLTDFVKTGIAAWQLRKERWVRNLAGS